MRLALAKALLVCTGLAVAATPAHAAFPGTNGKLAWGIFDWEAELVTICSGTPGSSGIGCDNSTTGFDDNDPAWSSDGTRLALAAGSILGDDGDIWYRNADGSGDVQVTSGLAEDFQPAWGPGDSYLTFARDEDGLSSGVPPDIYSIAPDGSGLANLTNHPASDVAPAPGPTGKIAFASDRGGSYDVYVMDRDGSNVTQLTHSPAPDWQPNWSPDGSRIAFGSTRDGNEEIYVMDADGSNESRRTTTPSDREFAPAWSPDGQQIAFGRIDVDRIEKINADGSGRQTLFQMEEPVQDIDGGPDWQPLPSNTPATYPRPLSASPVKFSLVPAYQQCTSPNRQHGPPLAFGSCAPPQPGSSRLMVGIGDGHPAPSRSTGTVRMRVILGAPGGVDDTSGLLHINLTNVQRVSDLSEYTGELRGSIPVRITSKEGTVSSTTIDFPLEFTVPCTPTESTQLKSTCQLTADLDALLPGATPEQTRAIWQLDQAKLYDGGPDEDGDTEGDNALFAVPGVFIP